jgi:hypothetical protein
MKIILIILGILLATIPLCILVFVIAYAWERGKLSGLDDHCKKDNKPK